MIYSFASGGEGLLSDFTSCRRKKKGDRTDKSVAVLGQGKESPRGSTRKRKKSCFFSRKRGSVLLQERRTRAMGTKSKASRREGSSSSQCRRKRRKHRFSLRRKKEGRLLSVIRRGTNEGKEEREKCHLKGCLLMGKRDFAGRIDQGGKRPLFRRRCRRAKGPSSTKERGAEIGKPRKKETLNTSDEALVNPLQREKKMRHFFVGREGKRKLVGGARKKKKLRHYDSFQEGKSSWLFWERGGVRRRRPGKHKVKRKVKAQEEPEGGGVIFSFVEKKKTHARVDVADRKRKKKWDAPCLRRKGGKRGGKRYDAEKNLPTLVAGEDSNEMKAYRGKESTGTITSKTEGEKGRKGTILGCGKLITFGKSPYFGKGKKGN